MTGETYSCGTRVDTKRGRATVIEADGQRLRVLLDTDLGRRDKRSWWIEASECEIVREEQRSE